MSDNQDLKLPEEIAIPSGPTNLKEFLAQSNAAGLAALRGHKAAGGMRASIYNAMPLEGVQALIEFMRDF